MMCAGSPEVRSVQVLMSYGADPEAKTGDGETATDLALRRDHPAHVDSIARHRHRDSDGST